MKTRDDVEAECAWQLEHIGCLKGKTIMNVCVHEEDGKVFPVLELDDATLIVVQSDAEGNRGGFLKIVPRDESVPVAAH